jgi:hypothetical protein
MSGSGHYYFLCTPCSSREHFARDGIQAAMGCGEGYVMDGIIARLFDPENLGRDICWSLGLAVGIAMAL